MSNDKDVGANKSDRVPWLGWHTVIIRRNFSGSVHWLALGNFVRCVLVLLSFQLMLHTLY